jgi:hypothetical protein
VNLGLILKGGHSVPKERLFTTEELNKMGERTLDLLKESIGQGDKEEASRLSQRMYNEFLAMHDLYRNWVTHLLSFVGKRFGDKVLYEALEETVSGFTKNLNKRYANKNIRRKFEILIAGLRGHLHPLKIEEDDEKFIITAQPCGSGGRLILEGGYDPPRNFLKVKKPQPMTFNRGDFPVYCAHCYLQNLIPAEEGGKPLFITRPADKLGEGPCVIYFYK